MDNLKDPLKKVLFNSLTWQDVALYADTESKKTMLAIKKHGIFIPGADYTSATQIQDLSNSPSATAPPSGILIKKSCTDDGELGAQKIVLNPICPCTDCNFEYGIELRDKVREPGINNPDFRKHFRGYFGRIAKITCTDGLIDDEYLLAMEEDMLHQATNDNQAWIELRREYIVVDDDNTTDTTLSITLEDGTEHTITATGHSAGQLASAINADSNVNTIVFAFGTTDADILMITSFDPGYVFTVTAGTDSTISERGLIKINKDLYRQVDVIVDEQFASVTKMSLILMSGTTSAGSTYATITATGITTVSGTASDHATEATFAGNINTAMGAFYTSGYARATAISTRYVCVWGADVIDRLMITHSSTSTTVDNIKATGDGSFPRMTADDIFREFAERHNGMLDNLVRTENTINGARYCRYDIHSMESGYPVTGDSASAYHNHKHRLTIYMLESLTDDLIWTHASSENIFRPTTAPTSATRHFDDLLEVWAKSAIAYW